STGRMRCWRSRSGDRAPLAEGCRHLRLRGAPAVAAAGPARPRLGHPLPDAARARARRVGVRARARGERRAGRRDPDARGRRPAHICARARLPRATPSDDPAYAPRPRRRVRPDRGPARRRAVDARLDIAGRGVLEHGLKDLARELDLLHAVRFLGHVTPIQQAVEDSLAVVVPSLGEGFGMVALEAMERARPVIAASIGGLEDLVRDGETGLLVPAGEAEPLAEAMLALASDPARAAAMGRDARRRALERFPEDRCTE